ncbi:hypothetical protein [Amaricoccus macauensis]|uniref:hypothetical protein n=1 Tax=Amaricoccus macauensis TaxID=57001 RepID=UPI003C7C5290
MRALSILAICALTACSNSVPSDVVIYEVPPPGFDAPPPEYVTTPSTGTASSNGGSAAAAAAGTGVPVGLTSVPTTTPTGQSVSQIGDDRLNLAEFSLEQQQIDAAAAEAELAAARSQLVVVQPTGVPQSSSGANIALFAQQTSNAVGEKVYQRSRGLRVTSNCGRYSNPDDAQRAFLDAGGPTSDRLGLDPDGDGFACRWDPAPYRALR